MSTGPVTPMSDGGKPGGVKIRFFLCSVPPSLLLASLLVPVFAGDKEYMVSYAFLFVVASAMAIFGYKKKVRRHVTAGTILMCLAPLLPHLVGGMVGAFLRGG